MLLRSSDFKERNYFFTPNLVRTSDREILITIKRGTSHGWEQEADAEMLRFDTVANRILEQRTIGHVPGRKFQLTLGTFFGDGSLGMFTDFQHTGDDGRHYRNGMRVARSADRGATFGPWRELGLVDGVEYGYPFDFIVEGGTAYMLAMTFGYRPGGRWSVDEQTDGEQTIGVWYPGHSDAPIAHERRKDCAGGDRGAGSGRGDQLACARGLRRPRAAVKNFPADFSPA